MKQARRLDHIEEYYFSRKLREVASLNSNGANVLNLGIGNPDQPPPIEVIQKLHIASLYGQANGYQGYKGVSELRSAIAQWTEKIYGVELNPEDEILPLMGSKEGIMHISQAFVNPDDEVLIPNPGYPTYRSVTEIIQAKVVEYDIISNQNLDMQSVAAKITNNTKILWLNMPNMPTGEAPNRKVLQELIYLAKAEGFLIVNDNPYSTILTSDYFSIFQLEHAKDVCLELNSLSKSHNMAGWRVGWVSGRKELIEIILKVKSNMDSGMYWPIQQAAVVALKQSEEWIQELNLNYKIRRLLVWKILDELGCSYSREAVGMFVWATIPDHYASGEMLTDYLLHEVGVFVTPGSVFGSNGNRQIRISLCSSEEELNEAIIRIENHKYLKNENKKIVAIAR